MKFSKLKTMKKKETYCKCKSTRPKDVMLDRCLICNKKRPKNKKVIPEYQGTMYY